MILVSLDYKKSTFFHLCRKVCLLSKKIHEKFENLQYLCSRKTENKQLAIN